MRIVIQRVQQASVSVDEEIKGEIAHGLLLLVCFEQGDDDSVISKSVRKFPS